MRLNRPTLLSDASIQAADVHVPDGVRILKAVPRDWMYICVRDVDGDGDVAGNGNSANISRQLSNTLEADVTVAKQQRYIWADGVGTTEPIIRDCVWSVSRYPMTYAP